MKKMFSLTPVKCLDGKRHRWSPIVKLPKYADEYADEHVDRWCRKCGSRSEWSSAWRRTRGTLSGRGVLVRCKDDGVLHMEIPDCHK